MAANNQPAGEPRPVSKLAFEWLATVTFVLLTVAELAAAAAAAEVFGLRSLVVWVCGLAFVNLMLARFAVDHVLKRFGMSRSGKTREVRGKAVACPEGIVGDDETVEVRLPKGIVRFILCSSLLGCTFFAGALAFVPHLRATTTVLGVVLTAFFGLGALNVWLDRKPQAWADRDGITGYPSGFHVRRRFVPWSKAATCEIETFYNTFGASVLVRPILKDSNGEVLMAPYLAYTEPEDQARLVKYIKAKLPKPKDDGEL